MQTVYNLQSIRYRDILFIDDLQIPAGSISVITGKSGSGKTTMLKLLNNLITCDSGVVRYYGTDVQSIEPVSLRRRAVMVSQTPYIFTGSVRDNLELAFRFNHKALPVQKEIESVFDSLGLPGMLNKDTSVMSGGEKQRLALIRVFLLDPETILLDEPTSALDAQNAALVTDYLSRWVSKPGKSAVMISHSGSLTADYAGFFLTLDNGRIAALQERNSSDE